MISDQHPGQGFSTGSLPNFGEMLARGKQAQINAGQRRADPTYIEQKPRPKLHPYAPPGNDMEAEYARRRSVAADQQQRIQQRVAADAAARAKATADAEQERQQAVAAAEVDYEREQESRAESTARLRRRLRREYGRY